jgi:hypothetical protein
MPLSMSGFQANKTEAIAALAAQALGEEGGELARVADGQCAAHLRDGEDPLRPVRTLAAYHAGEAGAVETDVLHLGPGQARGQVVDIDPGAVMLACRVLADRVQQGVNLPLAGLADGRDQPYPEAQALARAERGQWAPSPTTATAC